MGKIEQIIGDKTVAICGIGKYQQDLQYIFQTIEPKYYISDSFEQNIYNGCRVYRSDALGGVLDERTLIIVCDLEARKPGACNREYQNLDRYGLKWGKDYIFAEELFTTLDLDIKELVGSRKIAFWGTGVTTRNYYLDSWDVKTGIYPDVFINGTNDFGGGDTSWRASLYSKTN